MANRGSDGRFLPGNNANPRGRPPKIFSITSLVKEMLDQTADKTDKTWAQMVARAILIEASKGNVGALKELLDRIEGKVIDRHQIDVPVTLIRELVGKDATQQEEG